MNGALIFLSGLCIGAAGMFVILDFADGRRQSKEWKEGMKLIERLKKSYENDTN